MSLVNPADLPGDLDRAIAEMDKDAAAAYQDALSRSRLMQELVAYRKQRKISQQAVANAMDTVQSAVSELESGRSEPRLSTLQRYVRALDRELRVELSDEDPPGSMAAIARDVAPLAVEGSLGNVLKTLLRQRSVHGSRSADQLAEHTGLPEKAVDNAVHRLSKTGWVQQVGNTEQQLPIVTLNPNRALIVGVSIHRDHVQGIITDLRAETPFAIQRCDLPSASLRPTVEAITGLVSDLIRSSSDGRDVIGLGVEMAGVVIHDLGVVSYAPDLESRGWPWQGYPLQSELQAATGLRTAVENDCNALAVHEYLRRGDASDLAVVLMSEDGGIGCGIVHGGQLLHGNFGISGEIGHVVVDPDGEPCRHGDQRGCLETVASVTAIQRRVTEAEQSGLPASAVYRSAGETLGNVLATMTSILAPALIVIYGPATLTSDVGLAHAFDDAVRDRLHRGWFTQFGVKPNVEMRVLDPTAGARGAASVAISQFLHRPLRWLSGLGTEPQEYDRLPSGTVSM